MRLKIALLSAIVFALGFSAQAQQDTAYYQDSCKVFIQNAVTPTHPSLKLDCPCQVVEFQLSIYNRWGMKMLEDNTYTANKEIDICNMKKKDNLLFEQGVYYYTLNYSVNTPFGVKNMEQRGNITIIR